MVQRLFENQERTNIASVKQTNTVLGKYETERSAAAELMIHKTNIEFILSYLLFCFRTNSLTCFCTSVKIQPIKNAV